MDAFHQDIEFDLQLHDQAPKLDQQPNRQRSRTFSGLGKAGGPDRQLPDWR
jgi:hypothetical protein